MTITEFLEARIADDEAVAQEADAIMARYFGATEALLHSRLDLEDPGHDNPSVIVIDSTRILAECAAKRAIITEHEMAERSNGIRTALGCVLCNYDRDYGWEEDGPCKTLRALTSIYKDHPDYQQEWA